MINITKMHYDRKKMIWFTLIAIAATVFLSGVLNISDGAIASLVAVFGLILGSKQHDKTIKARQLENNKGDNE